MGSLESVSRLQSMEVKEDVYEGRFSAKINAKNSIKKISCELKHEFRNHLPILSNFLPYENDNMKYSQAKVQQTSTYRELVQSQQQNH